LAKKKVKKTRPVAAPSIPAADIVPDLTPEKRSWERVFPYAITLLFFILSLTGILHHEMWRDEYQAWMVATDADSFSELYRNMKYEGNPMLWHVFLFLFSSVTRDPFSMQLFHILISTAFVFLINRYSPFTLVQKILVTFGYFTFFEYNLISRSYGLGFLLIVLFCALYRDRKKYIWWMAGILFLLGNCTIFGVIIATGLTGLILLERFLAKPKTHDVRIPWAYVLIFSLISIAGVIMGYLQIRPEPDNTFWTFYVTGYDLPRLVLTCAQLIQAYIPVPDFSQFHFWNTHLFAGGTEKFLLVLTPVVLLISLLSFWRNKLVMISYFIMTLTLLFFHYYSGLVWSRYTGHLLLVFITCQWLVSMYPVSGASGRFGMLAEKVRPYWFVALLVPGCFGGVYSYILDLKNPFSTSMQAAQYIKANGLDSLELIATKDYVISPLASQLGRELYYAERQGYGSFIIYDSKRVGINGIKEVVPMFDRFYQAGKKRMIMIKDRPVMLTYDDTGESILWEDAMMTDQLNLKLLTKIDPGIVADESYYIYSIDEKLGQERRVRRN
jgi:hypothetical protein